ncbi:MAG TPA: hypothetical protein VMT05_09435 [Terriglobales bacterium]|nr:hypothetical protein [Terriglobales bacterium]
MRPIDTNTQLDSTAGIIIPDLKPGAVTPPTPATPAVDQQTESMDPKTATGKHVERDLETAYFKGELDKAQPHPDPGVLYDNKKKPGKGGEAGEVAKTAPVKVAGHTSDDLNRRVATEAANMVGKPVVGSGQCYDLADQVLRDAGAKSAPNYGKVTKSEQQNYQWGTKPIDPKDVKPGDVVQFRDHEITIRHVTKTTKTLPGGGKSVSTSEKDESHWRGQHTGIVLSKNADGSLNVAEQHVKDPSTGKLSETVRQNKVYTEDTVEKHTPKHYTEKGGIEVEEQTTDTITVKGTIWPYRPEEQGS